MEKIGSRRAMSFPSIVRFGLSLKASNAFLRRKIIQDMSTEDARTL